MKDDTFSEMMSDHLKARIDYFLDQINLAWEYYIKELVSNAPYLKGKNIDDLYHNAIKKYQICSKLLIDTIKEKEEKENNNIQLNDEEIAQYSMSTMMFSGSMLEASIQFFLLAYLDDYEKDEKYRWTINGKEVDFKKIKDTIDSSLTNLVDDNTITDKQKKKITDAVDRRLFLHEKWLEIVEYPLENLIQFCKENEIFDKKEHVFEKEPNTFNTIEINAGNNHLFEALCEGLDAKIKNLFFDMDNLSKEEIELGMSSIQKKRNNIHLFTKENICTLDEADKNIKTLCLIINELGSRISYRNDQIEQMRDDMASNL